MSPWLPNEHRPATPPHGGQNARIPSDNPRAHFVFGFLLLLAVASLVVLAVYLIRPPIESLAAESPPLTTSTPG